MNAQITVFWGLKAEVRSAQPPLASLYIDAAGLGHGTALTLMFDSKMPLPEQAAIADRVLAGVQRWRDGIAEKLERERTAEAELAAARAEIARLKSEYGEEADE